MDSCPIEKVQCPGYLWKEDMTVQFIQVLSTMQTNIPPSQRGLTCNPNIVLCLDRREKRRLKALAQDSCVFQYIILQKVVALLQALSCIIMRQHIIFIYISIHNCVGLSNWKKTGLILFSQHYGCAAGPISMTLIAQYPICIQQTAVALLYTKHGTLRNRRNKKKQ